MFTIQKNSKSTLPAKLESVLGADTDVQGRVSCRGSLRVDGRVEGDVRADAVTVGEGAVVQGDICAKRVVVGGKVLGNIAADNIEIKSRSQIFGDLRTKQLSIAEGAKFEGNCCMAHENDLLVELDRSPDVRRPVASGDRLPIPAAPGESASFRPSRS